MMTSKTDSKFYLGKLCVHGHDHKNAGQSLRYKSNKMCVACLSLSSAKYRASHSTQVARGMAEWRKHIATREKTDITVTKLCTRCQQIKSSHEFFREKYSASGLRSWCKSCCSKYQSSPKTKQRLRNWYKSYSANPEVRERIKAQGRERAATPKYKEYRKYYETTDKCKATRDSYRKGDRRKEVAHNYKVSPKGKATALKDVHKRRTLKAQALHTPYSKVQLEKHFERFSNACAYCGATNKITLDHFIPLSKSGVDSLSNFVPACLSCNSSKQFHNPKEWYRTRPFYSQQRWDWILRVLTRAQD